jgi:hypothetical protein
MKGPSGCAAKFKSVALRYWRKLSVFSRSSTAKSVGYCGRYVGLQDSRRQAFSYNKRTMDWAMRPFWPL